MADVVIQNPVINSPFTEPERHFEFGERGITGQIQPGRRDSSFFVPIAGPRRSAQLSLENEWVRDRLRANELVNPTPTCHVSHIVCDTGSWEQKVAQSLEEMDEVRAYVKNDRQPGFSIPYTVDGEQREYFPDFIARVDDGNGDDDLLNVVIEVTGEQRKDKKAKTATAEGLWVPAVNNHGGFGRWSFVEVDDPWSAKKRVRSSLQTLVPVA